MGMRPAELFREFIEQMIAPRSAHFPTARRIGIALVRNTGIAFFVLLMVVMVEGQGVSRSRLIGWFLASFAYSQCIGMQMEFLVPLLWPRLARQRFVLRWTLVPATIMAIVLTGTLTATLILTAFGLSQMEIFWPQFWASLRISVITTAVFGLTGVAYELMRSRLEQTTLELRTKELERERALKLATEARLSSLESRIHPHFLFNTLNSISSLIREDPARAERLIERMAALLRFSLDAGHQSLVPLSHELRIVDDYLEIEQARFGQRLHFSIEVSEELGEVLVPPLSIQTLAENAVKYAVAPRREGGTIRITAGESGAHLDVTVADDGPGFTSQAFPAGHGLENLQSRVQMLFGSDSGIRIERVGEWTHVTVSVPRPVMQSLHAKPEPSSLHT